MAGDKEKNGAVAIVFVDEDGKRSEVTADIGESLMEVGLRHGVRGVEAICGGSCACATCHVYFDEKWFRMIGPASEMEAQTLYFGKPRRPTSRLACQVTISAEHDGLVVHVP